MLVRTLLFKFLLFVFTFSFLMLSFPLSSFANANFTTDYTVSYTVAENGLTHADLRVTLTNTTSQYYASSYKVQVGFEDIRNVKASDAGGAIKPVIARADQGNTITVAFNKKVVGLGNKLHFTISFDTPEIAKKNGKIWEINIPGIANQNDFNDFNVTLNVPDSFGKPAYIKPHEDVKNLTFTKDQLGKSGISIAFGDQQIYAFNLAYHLRNKNLFPINTEIALPPTTNYQSVSIDSITPRPQNVLQDKDGNWLAQYTLTPSKSMDVTVTGKAIIYLEPKKTPVPDEQLQEYVKSQPYWQFNSSKNKELAKKLQTPEAIYNYVVEKLQYDFSRVSTNKPRLGAETVLANPTSAVCREFTDLFIALARAANIPAREVNGYAFTENSKQRPISLVKDILHAWPEYYDRDKQTWVMVDPTWGNTTGGVDYFHTLDFDHFAFIIKGEDSDYPVPAGGYKYQDDKKKDVHVSFAEDTDTMTPKIEILPKVDDRQFSLSPITGSVTITNVSGVLAKPQNITINADVLSPRSQSIPIGEIPPFGHKDFTFSFKSRPFLTNNTYGFTILVADKAIHESVHVTPLVLTKQTIIGGIVIGILTFIVLIVTIRTRRL